METIVQDVLYAVAVIGGLGLVFGAGLGLAGKKFAVLEDETFTTVRGILPGANCGGCGFLGCDELARAIINGDAQNNACPVGGPACAAQIAQALGQEAAVSIRKTAFIKCAGDDTKVNLRYEYSGQNDCRSAVMLSGGGAKSCKYGCLGMGTCATVCEFGAISYSNGIAVVDSEKCTACGKCAKVCPRRIIELVPYDNQYRVACMSSDPGKVVRSNCSVGCIACKICEKACAYEAIKVDNMLAKIDYEKCERCGACSAKCPSKVITS